jgi:hypothetical protein
VGPAALGNGRHLVRRFVGSLRPGGPAPIEEAWARSQLLPGEVAIWTHLSGADRRHAAGVARDVAGRLGPLATRPVLAAALLHDSGKLVSGYGTLRRVGATLLALGFGRSRWKGRLGDYLHHDELGAEQLARAGSDPLTVAWTREHHRPPSSWTLDPAVAHALKAADDD